MVEKKAKNKNDYKIIIAELGVDPFHVTNIIFALMCVIPLLAVVYIVVGRHLLYNIFIGVDGAQMLIAILIAIAGLFYAYNLVRNLTGKLLVYAEERRQADCEKKEFMMSVSRDLITSVEVIKLEIGNIAAGMDSVVGGIIGETVKRCLNAANKIVDIINNIRDFPGAEFVRTNVHRKLVDLRDIVKTELARMEWFAKNNNMDLKSRFVTEDASLWGDEKKLSIMITNLIYNVIRSAPQSGVVNVSVSSDDDTVQLVVGSVGPESLPKNTNVIFEKSGKPGEYPEPEGLAGEISIAKDIVELHKGHFTVNDEPDKEMGFKIVLPRDLRTRNGAADIRGDRRDRADSVENENINMWLALNKALTEIVSKSKTKR